jgi:hypothetical protein
MELLRTVKGMNVIRNARIAQDRIGTDVSRRLIEYAHLDQVAVRDAHKGSGENNSGSGGSMCGGGEERSHRHHFFVL